MVEPPCGPALPSPKAWIGATLLLGALAVGSVRAATAEPPRPRAHLQDDGRRQAFEELASLEPTQRMEAARKFAGDAWSQDDDFHAVEMQAARRIARRRGVSLGEVLRALDDGMREGWPMPSGVQMKTTVAPCRPRPVY
jgi:hypothetical protein